MNQILYKDEIKIIFPKYFFISFPIYQQGRCQLRWTTFKVTTIHFQIANKSLFIFTQKSLLTLNFIDNSEFNSEQRNKECTEDEDPSLCSGQAEQRTTNLKLETRN